MNGARKEAVRGDGQSKRTLLETAIYPITPSSPMAELADQWSSEGRTNVLIYLGLMHFQAVPTSSPKPD